MLNVCNSVYIAAFSAMGLKGEIEPKKVAAFEQKKAELKEQIDGLTKELDELKAQRKAVEHHITIADLPEPIFVDTFGYIL